MKLALAALSLSLTLPSLLRAQPATSPAFEVASIKPPHHSDRYLPRTGSITDPSTLIRLENWTLFGLIYEAWKLHDYQIRFNPAIKGETVADDLYDIVARAPGVTIPKPDDARAMLRNLLIDRFHMQTHTESKLTSVYAITVSKKGARLTPAANPSTPCAIKTTPAPDGRNITETFTNCPFDRLADRLGNLLGNTKPVLDGTSLTDLYDFRLTLLPDYRAHTGATDSDVDPQTALAPLGLALTAQKAPVRILVVDSFEIPKEN